MANPIPMDTRLNEPQAQSTSFRNPVEDGQLNSRRGMTALDIEAGELEPIISSENEALDSERRPHELKRRQVQMMAFGTNEPVFQIDNDSGASLGTGILYGPGGQLYLSGPISSVLGYLVMGSIQYAVVVDTPRIRNTKSDYSG
jgi:amino acid permease